MNKMTMMPLVLALAQTATAATVPNFDANLGGVGEQLGQAAAPAPAKKKAVKQPKPWSKEIPDAQAVTPEIVSDVAAFALTPEEIAQANKALPDPESPLGQKLAAIVKRAYVGGVASADYLNGKPLKITTWNINAAHTDKAVEAVVSAMESDPEGVRAAMGRKKPLDAKAQSELDVLAASDVYLMQEIPLPTAIRLAEALKCQVFWAPEFVEVGDNAKGRDPLAGWDYTGNAILSRVALSDFKVLRFGHQADWYYVQKGPQPLGDKLENIAGKVLFAIDAGNAHQTRPQAPYGGRLALFARTAAKDGLHRQISVADIHLEDKVGPELRRAQMNEVIASIKAMQGPVLFGGDLNSMGNNVGVGEGEDMATEWPNARHPLQPPIDRQHGYVSGTGNKFMTAVSVGNLTTTLANHPGDRKTLVAEQTFDLGIHVMPYGSTVQDGVNAIKNIKKNPTPVRILYNGAEVAADFFPYSAPAMKGFDIYKDEKARHDPSSRFNAERGMFVDIHKKLEATPMNPRTGFRFGMGGYQSTWSSGRPMGLVDTVLDWLFVYDPTHAIRPPKGQVLKQVVAGTKTGSKPEDRVSDHYPLSAEIPLAAD